MAKTTKRQSIAPGIQVLISWYQYRAKNGNICSTGRERLQWWRKNARKFPSVKAAMETWETRDIRKFADDRGLIVHGSTDSPGLRIDNIDQVPLRLRAKAEALQAEIAKLPSPWRIKFFTLDESKIVPNIWIAQSGEGE